MTIVHKKKEGRNKERFITDRSEEEGNEEQQTIRLPIQRRSFGGIKGTKE